MFTLMEHRVLLKMRELMGYKTGDGIFCPGGSISNMYGMNLARYKMFPEVKAEGNWAAPRLCFFASEQVTERLAVMSKIKMFYTIERINPPIVVLDLNIHVHEPISCA